MGDEMHGNTVDATTEDPMKKLQAELLASFEGSHPAPQQEAGEVSTREHDMIVSLVKNPQLIDGLSAYDARACVEEVNRVFCGGKYDYMMPNKTHDRAGVQYPGVRDDGTWDDKATLRQMCEDVAWMEAAQKGVGELQKILDNGYGAKLGMTGEDYAALSLRDKAKKILDTKAIPGADELSESFKTWMNSWSTAQKPTHRDVATGAVGGAVLTKKVPNEDWLKAMRKPDEYDDADVGVRVNGRYHYEKVVTQPFKKGMFWDTPEKFEWRPNDNGMVTVDGKKYTLVSTDDNGKKLVRPFFVSDDGSTLEGYISGIDKGAHDYYKFSNYDEKNPVHEAAVKNAMQKVGAKDMDDFGEKVWMSGGRVLEVDGDRFFARRTKDGYRIEVGDGGRSEYEWNVVSKFQDQFDNERNAMNAIVVREIFNANPEVLRWYNRYMETAKDNVFGQLDRRGDWSKVFDEFMDEYKQYAKDDAELSEEGRAKKREYETTFAQFVDVLQMTDHREGFGYLGSKWTDWASGLGNTGLRIVNYTYNLFADGLSFYAHLADSKSSYYDRFKSWARDDMKVATATQIYDQGTLIGLIGEEAAQLLAFSAVMKVGSLPKLLNYAGRTVNATGRAMKGVGIVKAGQKVKSVGQSLVEAGRKMGGGTKTALGGFRRIEVKAGQRLPKNAIRIGEEWYVQDVIQKPVGNFMQQANSKSLKVEEDVKKAIDRQRDVAAQMTGKIGVDEAAWKKVYDGIEELEKMAAKEVGSRYGQVSQWCLDLANELPALVVTGGAMADAHKAMSAYSIGQGFVKRDEKTGKATAVEFDYKPLEVAEKYAIYDAAGNTVFMLHIPRVLKSLVAGEAGTRRAQIAARGWYNSVMEAMQKGEYNRANALLLMYENAPRRLMAGALHGAAIGTGMSIQSQITANAENIALDKLENPDKVFTVEDYLLDEEQALNTVKSAGRMAAGMVAVGAAAGALREVPNLSRNWRMVTAMKRFGDANLDLWAMMAGAAHVKGRQPIDMSKIDTTNPDAAAKQMRQILQADAETYSQLSADTNEFITRAVSREARFGDIGKLRDRMVQKYGEDYARVMDGIIDYVKTSPELMSYYVSEYIDQRKSKPRSFEKYGMKEVTKGVGDMLGIKMSKARKLGDGSYAITIDIGGRGEKGKGGKFDIVFRSGDIDNAARKTNDDGSFSYNPDYVVDIVDAMKGRNPTFTRDQYGDLMDEYAKMSEADAKRMDDGVDVNGFLTRVWNRIAKLGGDSSGSGFFRIMEGSEVDGGIGTRRVATMNASSDNLKIEDFAHETVHGIISALRDRGFFRYETKDAEGKDVTVDMEDTLRRYYGLDGTKWEEPFVQDLLTQRQELATQLMKDEGVASLFESRNPVARLMGGLGQIMKLPFTKGRSKTVRSEVEKALDAKVEEAKRVQDDAKIDEAAKEIKIQDELPEEVKADVDAKTPDATALVVSRNPIPNSVMMKDVPEDAQAQRRAELNASGFYYDSQHDVWVNEFSAPSLYHRAVNEVIAKKVQSKRESMDEAMRLYRELMAEAAVEGAKREELQKKYAKIRELVAPEEFTEAEKRHLGIVVTKDGEPIGIINSKDGFITDGTEIRFSAQLPDGAKIVPYDHDLHGRWSVRGGNRDLSAVHNCSAQSLLTILNKKGGVPGLSFALIASDRGHTRFGPISVLVKRPTIDPKTKYPKTPEGRKQKNYLYKENVGTPDVHDFEQVKSGGNELEKAVEAVNQFEQYIFHGTEMDEGIRAHEYERGAYWLRATNVDAARKERENALYSGAPHPTKYDLFATDAEVYDSNGELIDPSVPYVNPYWEAKLGRALPASEIGAVVIPKFSKAAIEGASSVKSEVIDEDAVIMAAERAGLDPVDALKRVYDAFKKNPESVRSVLKPFSTNTLVDMLEQIKSECSKQGIPVYEYDVDDVESLKRAMSNPLDNISVNGQLEAQQRAFDEVKQLRFGVVGSRGASRYFADSNENIDAEIRSVIDEAIASVDEGTRKGLKSSKNAELNKWLAESGKDKFGPFILHIGGTDGDPLPRLEYAGRKPKIPQGFLDRINNGETFRLYDFIGDANKDSVFKKAYPELQDTPVFTRHSAAKNGVKEPAWGDDNTFVLANEDGKIVIDERRWNPRTAPEQIAAAVVGLVQKTEGWQERIRQSDARVAEALSPSRQKRMNSDLAFRLSDPRLILGDRLGRIVEEAVKKRLGKSLKDSTLKDVAEAIIEKIRTSVKDFAGEAEAKFLASRFGLPEEKLRDYSQAEKVFKDTLVAFGEGMTSEVQTKKNLAYWDDVILRAVDVVIFGKDNAGKLRRDSSGAEREDWKSYSVRPEFRDAIANEMLEAIVRNIMSGSRAARTDTEARLAGLLERGERGRATGGDERGVAYADGERTLSVEADIDGIDGVQPEPADTRVVLTGTASIDAKWEKAKFDVARTIREELDRVREVVKSDITKAKSEQDRLMKKIRKLVDENSTTSDLLVKDSMFSEALRMAQGGDGRWRVVGSRRTPKRLLTEAAAARMAKSRLDGHRNDDATRTWLEERARRIGVIEANRSAFVAEVMSDASAIADAIVARSTPSQRGADTIRAAEAGTAQREFVKRVLNGFRAGYATGSRGTDAELRAKMEADRIRTRMAKDARGMSTSELNSILGGDIVKDLVEMRDTYGNGDALAIDLISKFSDWMMRNDPRFRGMTKEEFEASSVARNELARTVSSWLMETARQLAYGQTREWAMREAARLKKQSQTFGSIHMTIAKHAEHMATAMDEQNVDALLDRIDKQIDTFADGDAAVAQSVPDYQRKIAPRLQEYWKYVKKAMRMTDEAADKEARRLNGILNLTDQQLLDLGTKGSGDLDAAESGLREREDAMMRLNAIMRFGSMKYKNYGECISIFNGTMANELAGEMQRHMVLREKRLADDAAIRQAFIGELTAIRRAKKGDDFDALDNGTRTGNFLTFSVADLFKRMQLYLHEGTDAWNFVDSFRQQMSLGHIDKTMFISGWEGKMREAAKRIYGVNFERLVEDMMVKRPEYDKFSRSHWAIPENAREVEVFRNGKKRKVKLAEPQRGNAPTNLPNHLSKANLLYIYAACQQSDMQINNLIWGRDAAYLREIENIIGPEGVQMAQWLTKAYAEMRKTLDPISREISGMPILSPDERYCPLSFIQEQVSNDERRFTSSPFPSFLTRRVMHDSLRLNETCDAFRTFEDKIQDSGHYLGFARIIDRMNTTLKHPKVQTAYAQLYGTKAKNDIYAQLADALNGGRKNSDTLLLGVRNFVTATSLFGNIGSSLKQLEGIGGWAVEMGIGKWLKALAVNPATSSEVREGVRELIDAGLFKTRAEEGISEAMVALMNSCDGVPHGPVSRTYSWYKRHGMDITKFVDKIASMSMAGQYYVGRRNWYIRNGLREEDAKRRALADTDYAIQTTQQSGRSEFLHAAQRGGTAGKILTQFSGPSFVRWGIECASWHRAVVMGDRGAYAKLLSRMVALHLICPAILSLAGGISMMMFKRDDQKSKDIIERTEKDIIVNCLTGPMSGWFIYGQVINAFANETVLPDIKEQRAKVHFEAPVLSKLHTLQQLTSKMYQDVIKTAPWDTFTEREQRMIAEDALRIFQLLVPASRVANPVKRIAKELGED